MSSWIWKDCFLSLSNGPMKGKKTVKKGAMCARHVHQRLINVISLSLCYPSLLPLFHYPSLHLSRSHTPAFSHVPHCFYQHDLSLGSFSNPNSPLLTPPTTLTHLLVRLPQCQTAVCVFCTGWQTCCTQLPGVSHYTSGVVTTHVLRRV